MSLLTVFIIFVCICVDNMVTAHMSSVNMNKENKTVFPVRMALFFTGANVIFLGLGYLISVLFFRNWVYFAHRWVAFAFLLLLGIKLMLESIEKSPSFRDGDIGSLRKLIKVSVLIGLNSFLVGYALETMDRGFFPEVILLLITTFLMTLLGSHLGGSVEASGHKTLLSKRLELAAGVVLAVIAICIIII